MTDFISSAGNDTSVQQSIPAAGRITLMTTYVHLTVGLFSIAPALPAIQAAAGRDANALISAPLVGSIAGFTYALTAVLCGSLTKRLGYRRVLLWSLTVSMLAGLAGAAWANLTFILLTRAIVGAAVALIVNAGLFAVGTVVPVRSRTGMLGVMAVIGSIAGIILFPLVGTLSAIDWRLAFLPHVLTIFAIPMVMTLPHVSPVGRDAPTATRPGRSRSARPPGCSRSPTASPSAAR